MPNKKHILNSVKAVAKRLGHAPSLLEFVARSGISAYFVFQSFPRWSDAIRAARLPPYTLNVKVEDRALLEDWGKAARRNKAILRNRATLPRRLYRREGKYNPHTLAIRFGGWSSVPRAFRNFAKGKREWADVLTLMLQCHAPKKESGRSKEGASSLIPGNAALKDRPLYGNPIDFRGLRHEPVNEQGVVLLFGMLASDLGFMIEAVQTGFPDCEAMRQVAPERWQRVYIEFEYESKNFRDHGHPLHGCDVIVCWRHNWPACPKHIEVLELSSLIKSLPNPVVGQFEFLDRDNRGQNSN